MTLDELASRFPGAKRTGAGFQAKCPAHEDDTPSLSISEGKKALVVHCHGGCKTEDVLAAVGLDVRALFTSRRINIVAEYSYTDATGTELYQCVRLEPKSFRQRHKDANGKWVWSLAGITPVLYRLPKVLEAKRVFIVEGEKDVHTLEKLGVVATCNPMGAGKWRRHFNDALVGKEVIIIPDNDEPGAAHGENVLRSLGELGINARVVKLPKGKDVTEWNPTLPELEALLVTKNPFREADPEVDKPGPAPLRGLSRSYLSAVRLLRDERHRELLLGPGRLGLNTMSGQVMLGPEPLPPNAANVFRAKVEEHIRVEGGMTRLKLGKEDCKDALEHVARENKFMPVREHLEALGRAHPLTSVAGCIEHLGREALGLTEPLELSMLKRWFISAVARPMNPGCKVDTVLVLVGPQGYGKSRFFRTIGGPWFCDSRVDLTSKDAYLTLTASWIHEWSELASMRNKNSEDVKAFVSSQRDTFRAPYESGVREHQRHSVIVGTTNEATFLHDVTGNRRFWPIRVRKPVNVAEVGELRDRALAEAMGLLAAGYTWWMDPEESKTMAEAIESYLKRDPWEDMVASKALPAQVTVHYVLNSVIGKQVRDLTPQDGERVAGILRGLGYSSRRMMFSGRRQTVWELAEKTI